MIRFPVEVQIDKADTRLRPGMTARCTIIVERHKNVLRLPIKTSFATSLAVASLLAVPGTLVHTALGHVDWAVVAVFGAASVPLSYVGARVGLRMNALWLERLYGAALTILGIGFLIARG